MAVYAQPRSPETGSAILMTMVLIVALLGGGVTLVRMQMSGTRSAEIIRSGVTANYCAEAGLAGARASVAKNYAQWNAGLAAGLLGNEPTFLQHPALDHDLNGDGVNTDFTVILKDNKDEPGADVPGTDNDLQVWIVSTCNLFPENKKQASELVRVSVGGTCYQSQLGGCGGNNNSN